MECIKLQKRILYIMHVDWNWIKQRPQFLAEELSKTNKVLVLYQFCRHRKFLTRNSTGLQKIPLLPIPRLRNSFFRIIDIITHRFIVQICVWLFKPTVIWVTFPFIINYINKIDKNITVIYDCMDDALEFFTDDNIKYQISIEEKELVNRASWILCSSQHLLDKMVKRYGCKPKFRLVRNGIQNISSLETTSIKEKREIKCIAYIGTVAEWFDYGVIKDALEKVKDIEFHIIGPVMEKNVYHHERLIFHGPVEHSKLFEYNNKFDCYMMPFKLNPLIESVDPVKLYEYIMMGKPIISVYYKEIERFSPYVHFYSTNTEFVNLIEQLSKGILVPKANIIQGQEFLSNNTWSKRAEEINILLDSIR